MSALRTRLRQGSGGQAPHSAPRTPHSALRTPHSALIVRLGSLGDLVHVVPAVAALREAWPDAQIDWLVEPPHAPLLELVPAVSRVVVLKGRSIGGWWATRRELRARRYDIALDFQGLVKSAALARLSGARRIVGFDTAALREPAARFFYTEQVEVGEGRHVIDKNLALAEQASGGFFAHSALRTPHPPAPTLRRASFALRTPHFALRTSHSALRTPHGVTDFALLNPGAAWPNKRWPPERFGEVARRVRDVYGWTSIVLWGPGEADLAAAVVAASGGAAVSAPQTTFNDVLALAGAARVMVSGDTGPLHLAAAAGCPIVALFGPTTPERNGPWDDRDVSISQYAQCACHFKRVCRQPDRWCLADIQVDQVVAAIRQRVTPV